MQNFFALTHPSGGVWTVIRHQISEVDLLVKYLTMMGSCNFSVMNFEFGVCSQNKMLSKFSAFDPPDADE